MQNIEKAIVDQDQVVRAIIDLGISPKNKGFYYLVESVYLYANSNESWRLQVVKDIYPRVAESFGTSPKNVERSIRYTLLNHEAKERYTDYYRLLFKHGTPTNAHFLTVLGQELRMTHKKNLVDENGREVFSF